jgi:hypothetical protein
MHAADLEPCRRDYFFTQTLGRVYLRGSRNVSLNAVEITLLIIIGGILGGSASFSAASLTSLHACRNAYTILAMDLRQFVRSCSQAAVNTIAAAGGGLTHPCLRAKVQELVRFKPHQMDSPVYHLDTKSRASLEKLIVCYDGAIPPYVGATQPCIKNPHFSWK